MPSSEPSDSVGPGARAGVPDGTDDREANAAERIRELEALLAAREAEAREATDRFLRARADMENSRKRAAREQVEAAARIAADTVAPFLDVADDLERALAEACSDASPLAQGVRLIRDKLVRFLSDMGVTPIDTADARFDPALHEALGAVPAAGAEPDAIVQEIQRGYRLGDRVLRPSRVLVALPAGAGEAGDGRNPNDP